MGCCEMYVGSKSDQQNYSEEKSYSLKYKTTLLSDVCLSFKMLKVKRVILEKCHQMLALLL